MALTGLAAFDQTVQHSVIWLSEVMAQIATDDRDLAYQALRATLHGLRDRLTPGEAAELGVELPMLLRGVYYDGWRPNGTASRSRADESFLSLVRDRMSGDPRVAPDVAVRAVLAVLDQQLSKKEFEHVRQVLPEEVASLWPNG